MNRKYYSVLECLNLTVCNLHLALAKWNQESPILKKYFYSSKAVLNYGSIAKFSDKFDALDANLWKLYIGFKAYSTIFPGTLVSHD